MTLQSAAVGPVDVAQFLADVKAGKKQRRTAHIDIYLDPEVVAEHNALVAEYNALVAQAEQLAETERSITDDGPASVQVQLAELDERDEQLIAAAEASKVRFTFRSYEPGDQQAVAVKLADIPEENRVADDGAILGVVQFLIDPVLTIEQVRELIPVIGWQQWNALCATYNNHVFGAVTAPKSRKPSPSRATGKR